MLINSNSSFSEKLVLFFGKGAQNWENEDGTFEVVYGNGEVCQFTSLIHAFIFYYKLDLSCSLWDITNKRLLIESKQVVG